LGLLFITTFTSVVITVDIKWIALAPELQGKGTPIHLIYLGSWQLILASSSIVILGACVVEAHRHTISAPRPRTASAGWAVLASGFAALAVIDWRITHATASEQMAQLGTVVVGLMCLCGSFCLYQARKAHCRTSDSSRIVN
jgi:hypothetical protein